jgi:hypothetical protein
MAASDLRIEYAPFVQVAWEHDAEWNKVQRVADALKQHMETPAAARAIRAANMPGRSSADIQDTIGARAKELGFESEKTGLFADSDFALRPDYFMAVGDTGILLEVERGKTTINNMDLLDFWKCHLCRHANYLFLLVPKELRQNDKMSPRREFASVKKRLAPFFGPGNETNVRGLCLFGY